MKPKDRIKLIVAALRNDTELLDRVEAMLNEPVEKPEPQPHEPWFRRQTLNKFERQRAEKEARETHIEHRNIGWREAQLPARWGQPQ